MIVSVIGIANSVELFQGDLTHTIASKFNICKNEQKLLFKPYTKDDIIKVLQTLSQSAISPYGV